MLVRSYQKMLCFFLCIVQVMIHIVLGNLAEREHLGTKKNIKSIKIISFKTINQLIDLN